MIVLLRGAGWSRLAGAALAGTLAELSAWGLTATAVWLLARAAQEPPLATLGLAVVAVRGCALARGGLRWTERVVGHDVALRAVADLRSRVYEALAARPGPRDGDALVGFVADVDAVSDLLLRCLLPATAALGVAGVALGFATALVPAAGAALAAGLGGSVLVLPAVAALGARRAAARAAAARAALAVRALDLVDGAADLAAFGATRRALASAEAAVDALARADRASAQSTALVSAAGELVAGLTAAAVTLVALRCGAGEVTVAVLAIGSLAAVDATRPLAGAARQLAELRPPARRVAALLADPAVPRSCRRDRKAGGQRVELEGVHVRYGGAVALDGVDLRIDPGRSVAVVGASGAGKSTLLHVLAGLVDPPAGSVVAPPARALTQDAHVFRATVRANLALARPGATDGQLIEAAGRAGLDVATSLPLGLATPLGEGGHELSGGQRQRLLLARVLLADPPLMLLDEPTEGLDPALADSVLAGLLAGRRGRTTVVVTHRLAGLAVFDEVVVVDRGRVVQRGSHAALAARPGPYRDMLEAERLTGPSRDATNGTVVQTY